MTMLTLTDSTQLHAVLAYTCRESAFGQVHSILTRSRSTSDQDRLAYSLISACGSANPKVAKRAHELLIRFPEQVRLNSVACMAFSARWAEKQLGREITTGFPADLLACHAYDESLRASVFSALRDNAEHVRRNAIAILRVWLDEFGNPHYLKDELISHVRNDALPWFVRVDAIYAARSIWRLADFVNLLPTLLLDSDEHLKEAAVMVMDEADLSFGTAS